MPTLADELSGLQPASFRGIRFPVTSRRYDRGTNEIATIIVYRNGEYVEVTCRLGCTVTYQVPMRSGIATSGYQRLFAKVPELLNAYNNTEPGPLIDPVHGEILVVPGAWSDELDARARDGIDVTLVFRQHTPISDEVDSKPATLTSIQTQNTALDETVAATPWTVQTQPETEGTDPLSAAAGLMNQVSYAKDSFDAKILSVGQKAGKVERAAAKLGVAGEPARRAARKLRLDCERTAAAPPREKAAVLTQVALDTPKTLTQIARDTGMTLEELLRADAGLVRSLIAPQGRRVHVKSRNRNA